MIVLKKKLFPFLDRQVIWFEPKPSKLKCFSTLYKQSTAQHNIFGYKRSEFYTKLINLWASEEEICKGFNKDTAYEIRRARKDGIVTGVELDIYRFVKFYNTFAQTKGLHQLGNHILHYGEHLMMTKATAENEDLVMHAYILDLSDKRVRLLYSASQYRNEVSGASKRALVGRANRLLHAEDMLLFKAQGFATYDMGGYAFGTKEVDLHRINVFKDGFGGELILENDYWPRTLLLALGLLALMKRAKRQIMLFSAAYLH
ncbi:hypothetical protein [Pedobacter sp. ASV28]|uniref:hypothetical protein n=1 Tax=Pedobacter sp. ASV28 TaxID=2795123 RepID=UPI0018EC4C14|nr:hypothetical protein [Pedobacter sp. ASV28]